MDWPNIVIAAVTVGTAVVTAAVPLIIGWAYMKKDIAALRAIITEARSVIDSLRRDVAELTTANAVMQTELKGVTEKLEALSGEAAYIKKHMLKAVRLHP